MAKRRGERPQRKNPNELTCNQHIHSRKCIQRFENQSGKVGVLRRPQTKPFNVAPTNAVFCAQRVWSQKAEASIFKSVEDAFQREVERAIFLGTVHDHTAVSAYFSIWSIRSRLSSEPPEDWTLNGVGEDSFTKDEEERLEKRGFIFMRGATLPSRLVAQIGIMPEHDHKMKAMRDVRWGVLRGPDALGLLCPDHPGLSWIPVNRHIILAARRSDHDLPIEAVNFLNQSAFDTAKSLVFGHPDDLRAFLKRKANPWASESACVQITATPCASEK